MHKPNHKILAHLCSHSVSLLCHSDSYLVIALSHVVWNITSLWIAHMSFPSFVSIRDRAHKSKSVCIYPKLQCHHQSWPLSIFSPQEPWCTWIVITVRHMGPHLSSGVHTMATAWLGSSGTGSHLMPALDTGSESPRPLRAWCHGETSQLFIISHWSLVPHFLWTLWPVPQVPRDLSLLVCIGDLPEEKKHAQWAQTGPGPMPYSEIKCGGFFLLFWVLFFVFCFGQVKIQWCNKCSVLYCSIIWRQNISPWLSEPPYLSVFSMATCC